MYPRPTLYVLGMKYIPRPQRVSRVLGASSGVKRREVPYGFRPRQDRARDLEMVLALLPTSEVDIHHAIESFGDVFIGFPTQRVTTERANDQYRSNLAMKISAMLGRRQFAAKVRSGALEKLEKLSIHDHRHAPSLVWPGRLIEGWFILRQALNVWGILHRAG
ncbi:hypothetical protein BD769DRAFT_1398735 [Suillus cothurnatus]|nr:hypothetical protein BD769DRAFT_1398735 [Suillus cothurnatus]